MTLLDGARRHADSAPTSAGAPTVKPWTFPLALVGVAVRAALAAAAGLVLTAGAVLLIWALTPGSTGAVDGVTAIGASFFAAAHGMTMRLGAASLSLPPLLFTAIGASLLVAAIRRGRYLPVGGGRKQLSPV